MGDWKGMFVAASRQAGLVPMHAAPGPVLTKHIEEGGAWVPTQAEAHSMTERNAERGRVAVETAAKVWSAGAREAPADRKMQVERVADELSTAARTFARAAESGKHMGMSEEGVKAFADASAKAKAAADAVESSGNPEKWAPDTVRRPFITAATNMSDTREVNRKVAEATTPSGKLRALPAERQAEALRGMSQADQIKATIGDPGRAAEIAQAAAKNQIARVDGRAAATPEERSKANAALTGAPDSKDDKRAFAEIDHMGADRKRGLSDPEARLAHIRRAIVMANAIGDPAKAQRRGDAWTNENFHTAAEVFYNRAALLHSQKEKA